LNSNHYVDATSQLHTKERHHDILNMQHPSKHLNPLR